MKHSFTTKALAMAVNFALVGTSMAAPAAPEPSAPKGPDFVEKFTPPASLGYVTDAYQGATENPLILIQDLHANYSVQKNIVGILEHVQPVVSAGEKPMVIGIEGAWGEQDLSWYRSRDRVIREKAGDFLLRNAEITGTDHFAALSETPVRLIGIEDPDSYKVHKELFTKSLLVRLELAKKLDLLRATVNDSRDRAPRALRRLWKLEEEFRAGRLSLERMSKELDVELTDYGAAEAALARQKMDIASAQKGDNAFFMKNVVTADHGLDVLSRLLRFQLTFEEVQYASREIPQMLGVVQALLPGESLAPWREAIRGAVDHYAVALLRDKPMADHAVTLARENPNSSIVVVAGGFHAAGIAETFRSKRLSYVTIAPNVKSHTSRDEALYLKRMMGSHVAEAEIGEWARGTMKASTLAMPGSAPAMAPESGDPAVLNNPAVKRTIDAAENPTFAADGPDVQLTETDEAINQGTEESRRTKLRGAVSALAGRIRSFVEGPKIGQVEPTEVDLPAESSESAAAAKEEAPRKPERPSSGTGKKLVGAVIATAILSGVNVAQAAQQNAAAVNANDASGWLVAGIAGLALGAVAAYKKRKELEDAARVARNKLLAGYHA